MEDITWSQMIFYYLLKHKELQEQNSRDLYCAYTEREAVMQLVKQQGDLAQCDVERYGETIYLIPREENDYLGFSKAQLKVALCKSNATEKDYYLSQFIILTLLIEFYDGQGSSSKVRDFMRVGELLNRVSMRLEEGIRMSLEEQQENGIAYRNMFEAYQALKSTDSSSRSRTTKEGFAYTILKFLEKQNLIDYIEADEMIKTTRKLDHFMDWNLLNRHNFHRVMRVLRGEENEQN
jgi:hypothetical protein